MVVLLMIGIRIRMHDLRRRRFLFHFDYIGLGFESNQFDVFFSLINSTLPRFILEKCY